MHNVTEVYETAAVIKITEVKE